MPTSRSSLKVATSKRRSRRLKRAVLTALCAGALLFATVSGNTDLVRWDQVILVIVNALLGAVGSLYQP